MTLKLNGSSSGYTAIDAPASAGSNTLVLPGNNGNNGEFLKTNGSGVTSWAAAGGGKVLQCVSNSTTTQTTVTNQSMTDTGLTCTINNVASGSKVLIIVNQSMRQYRNRNSTNNQGFGVNLLRASTIVFASRKNDNNHYSDFHTAGDGANNEVMRWVLHHLDGSPGTGTVTYKTQMANFHSDDSGQVWAQPDWEAQNQAPTSTLILMEIGS